MAPHKSLDEIKLTKAQRRLLERVVAAVQPLEVFGPEVASGRRLTGLGLVSSTPDAHHLTELEAAAAWLEANPRRGRRFVRDGLVERVDVRLTLDTARRLDELAATQGTNRNQLARKILESAVDTIEVKGAL